MIGGADTTVSPPSHAGLTGSGVSLENSVDCLPGVPCASSAMLNAASSTSALARPFADDLLHELLARIDVRLERLLHVPRDAVVLGAVAALAQHLLDLVRHLLRGA